VQDVRVAVRRGELATLSEEAKPLDTDVDKLQSFTERHS
jgi:hypothetical protein